MVEFIKDYRVDERYAKVELTDEGYHVQCSIGDVIVKIIDATSHSLKYAEDIAENWVMGIIKE
jgi:hypothetical protein